MIPNKAFVKNLPIQFSENDKVEFFSMFGGVDVISFHGKLKHCCLVSFPDEFHTKKGIEVLHQFEILGSRLSVEYAKQSHEAEANHINATLTLNKTAKTSTNENEKNIVSFKNKEDDFDTFGIAPNLNLLHDFPEHLTYKYPDPSVTILTNIANALACVPKFYVQVLHLMNKMNLPPPFTGPTPTPPMAGNTVNMHDACVDTTDLLTYCSSDESEIESDSEKDKKHNIYQSNQQDVSGPLPKRKRLKLIAKSDQEKFNLTKMKGVTKEGVESAFDITSSSKRLEFKLAASIQGAIEGKNKTVSYNVFDERGEFGKIQPSLTETKQTEKHEELPHPTVEQPMEESEEDSEDEETSEEYISLIQLKENRISNSEILSMNQFKNYKCGEITNRLYLKNLAKQVTPDDLNFIFIRFIRKYSDENKDFDIRLMQEGRMKGQAFITLPSIEIAQKALKLTHGYLLHSKPMVIQYARAAK